MSLTPGPPDLRVGRSPIPLHAHGPRPPARVAARAALLAAAVGHDEGAAFAAHYTLSLIAAARDIWRHAPTRAALLSTIRVGGGGGAAGAAGLLMAGGRAAVAAGGEGAAGGGGGGGPAAAGLQRASSAPGLVGGAAAPPQASLRVREEAFDALINSLSPGAPLAHTRSGVASLVEHLWHESADVRAVVLAVCTDPAEPERLQLKASWIPPPAHTPDPDRGDP